MERGGRCLLLTHRRFVPMLKVFSFSHLMKQLCIALVTTNCGHICALDCIYITFSSLSYVVLMLSCAHTPIDTQGGRTHPTADQLDHGVRNISCMQCGGQPTAVGMPAVKTGDRRPIAVSED